MFIPPQKFAPQKEETEATDAPLRLRSSHLLIDREIAAQVFKNDHNVHVVYYPKNNPTLFLELDFINRLQQGLSINPEELVS